jgi:hypothetical protein
MRGPAGGSTGFRIPAPPRPGTGSGHADLALHDGDGDEADGQAEGGLHAERLTEHERPQTAVTGAMRNMSALTSVTPERRRMIQYSPYPPKVDRTTSQVTAAQKPASAGGSAAPVLTANTVNSTALVAQWMVIATPGATGAGERLSRNVAATSDSMPSNGTNVFPDPIAHAREQAEALLGTYRTESDRFPA